MRSGDTIVAVASPPGVGARAVVRVSGPGVRGVLGAVCEDEVRFERGCAAVRLRLGVPALLMAFPGPASYTGEDAAELLIAGSRALVARLVERIASVDGVRMAGPGEFTARAYLNGKMTLEQAEGVAAVVAAESAEQLAAARGLMEGRAGAEYRAWADELAMLLALVEAGIDFTDQEDVVPIPPGALRARLEALARAIAGHLGGVAASAADGELPRVVLAGKPNAGKSTLFNALLGRERAVVSPVAGTTRDVLEEELAVAGAGSVMLVDVAGVDGGGVGVEAGAQGAARRAVAGADVVVHCDPSGRFEPIEGAARARVIRVRTKADLGGGPAGDVAVCALDGWHVPVLKRAIADAVWGVRGSGVAAVLPRHRRAMAGALAGIEGAIGAVREDERVLREPEVAADAMRAGLDAMGELVGRISPDDVIGRVFAVFCVGK